MLGMGHKAVGLSIEESGIRYISLKKNKSWEVRKKRTLPLLPGMIVENQVADGEAMLEIIKPWVKKQGLRGRKVSLTIPPAQIIIRKMSIPSTNDKHLEQLVKLEVETGLHLPFDNPVYDYVITGTDENESHLLVFAAPRKPIQDYIGILEKAGLQIGSVEISATALARSIALGLGKSFAETMLIHLEQSMMDIYMFRSGNPVFIRTISLHDLHQEKPAFGAFPLNTEYATEAAATVEEVGERLSPEQMVEITAEISRMLNFYQYSLHDGTTRISSVLITGSTGLRRQLHEELRQSLAEIEITPISLDQLGEGAAKNPELNNYRVAAGAALGSTKRHINLLPREDREALLFPYVATVLVGVWLLGTIGTGIYFASNKGQISNQGERLEGLRDQSAVLQLELGKINSAGGAEVDRTEVITEVIGNRPDAAAILDELTAKLPQSSVLRDINYIHQQAVALTVNVQRMDQAAEYLEQLRGMSFAVEASIEKLTDSPIAGTSSLSAAVAASLTRYTAVYKVSLIAPEELVQGQGDGTSGTVEGAVSVGTDQ
ncbi:pilus assembly protein PilM [Paenibacillus sp. BR2-3]|uniref:pilus assembly protein PilM n=1 Tax=Paenibacillus sp. BR2-3 TaxID=3048494 RepID=UPI0039775F31